MSPAGWADAVRVLVVGVGDIARKAYLPVLSARPDLQLHLATRNARALEESGRMFRVAGLHAGIDDALAAGTFDAAFVHAATPAHPALVRRLLEHGIPTLVDKPLADHLADAAALVDLAQRRDTLLTVGFNRRFAPAYVALRDVGATLVTMEKHRHRHPDAVRRVVFDDFIHVADTLLFLAPGAVRRRAIETQVADGLLHAVTVTLAGGGFVAVGTMHRDSGLDEERVDVIGGGTRQTVLDLAERSGASGTAWRQRRGDWTPVGRQRGFEAMCDDFLKGVRERRPTDGAAILRTHELCEAIVRHAQLAAEGAG